MTYSQPPTKAAGETLTAADWNTYVGTNGSALFSPPACRATRTMGAAFLEDAVITLPTEAHDTHSMHDTSTNPERVTVPTGWGGIYHIGAYFTTTYGTNRVISLRINGTAVAYAATSTASAASATTAGYVGTTVVVSPGDYATIVAEEDMDVVAAHLEMVWLRGPV